MMNKPPPDEIRKAKIMQKYNDYRHDRLLKNFQHTEAKFDDLEKRLCDNARIAARTAELNKQIEKLKSKKNERP